LAAAAALASALFFLIPMSLVSLLAVLRATKADCPFLSLGVSFLAVDLTTGCLIGRTSPLICWTAGAAGFGGRGVPAFFAFFFSLLREERLFLRGKITNLARYLFKRSTFS